MEHYCQEESLVAHSGALRVEMTFESRQHIQRKRGPHSVLGERIVVCYEMQDVIEEYGWLGA